MTEEEYMMLDVGDVVRLDLSKDRNGITPEYHGQKLTIYLNSPHHTYAKRWGYIRGSAPDGTKIWIKPICAHIVSCKKLDEQKQENTSMATMLSAFAVMMHKRRDKGAR